MTDPRVPARGDRAAALQRWRAEWEYPLVSGAGPGGRSVDTSTHYGNHGQWLAFVLPVLLLIAAMVTTEASNSFTGWLAIVLIWAMVGLCAGGVGYYWRQHRRLAKQWRHAFSHLATLVAGQPGSTRGSLVAWLYAYWPGPYAKDLLCIDWQYGNVSFAHSGFAGLIDLDLAGHLKGDGRVHILLAASFATSAPALPQHQQDALRQALAALEHRGFQVTFEIGGLLANGGWQWCQRLQENPARVEELVGVAAEFVAVAQLSGAVPTPRMA